MDNIKNKIVLITGGASGLGLAYAQRILQNGAKAIAILDLPTSNGQTAAADLEKQFGKGKAAFFPCDVSNTQQFKESFKRAVTALNGVDIVINNAGIFNDAKWEQAVGVNVCGVIQGSLLAIEHMGTHKGGKGGTLVNIGSIVSVMVYPVCSSYCATKHAVLAFTQCLSHYSKKTGIRILALCPGVTETAILVDAHCKIFDFVDPAELQQTYDLPSQKVDNVAEAMIKLLQKGPNGAVWLSEAGKPPCAIEIPPVKKVEIPQ